MPEVLAVIPARGGSKGLPGKNIRMLGGYPLIAWSIAAAKQSDAVDRVICTTDSPEIAAIAREFGAEVPFMRPSELAGDDTLDLPVFQHALAWLDENEAYAPDYVVQLRPTSPFRSPSLIGDTVALLEADAAATSVRSIAEAPKSPFKMWRPTAGPYLQNLLDEPGIFEPYNSLRQLLPPVYWHTGTIDTIRTTTITGGSMTGANVLPVKIPDAYLIDIDTAEDFAHASRMVPAMTDTVFPGPVPDWSRIRLLVLDVDGTLTPGTMYYDRDGEAMKRFHTHDGHGIAAVKRAGVSLAIITGEPTIFAQYRAEKMGIDEFHAGIREKVPVLHDICARIGISLGAVAYVGDDTGDLAAIRAVNEAGGIGCAVADARPEISDAARYVTNRPGGYGAVRDVCDCICMAHGISTS